VQKLMKGEINLFKCVECGHEAQIESPLLFNDYRIGLKIQFYPEHVLKEKPEAVVNGIEKCTRNGKIKMYHPGVH